MDAMSEIRQTFFDECAEQLEGLEASLCAMENGTSDGETVGVAFRAVHSVKGGAASFKLKELVRFSLTFESVLNEVRSDRLALSPDVVALLRRAAVVLNDLVCVARDQEGVLAALRSHVPGAVDDAPQDDAAGSAAPEAPSAEDLGFTPVSVDLGDIFNAGPRRYTVVFTPRPELYANANESARLIREVLALGEGNVSCDTSATPLLDALEPEGAFLTWTLDLTSDAGEDAIREIFEFAEFDCTLEIDSVPVDADDAETQNFDDAVDPELAALFARLQAAE